MDPVGLGRLLAELVPVHAGGATVVLLLSVRRLAVVRPEERACPGVACKSKQSKHFNILKLSHSTSELHLPQLLPRPICVEVSRPDEGQVDPEGPAKSQ